MKNYRLIVLATLVMIFFTSRTHAQEVVYGDAIESVAGGIVNWSEGSITATGIGFPPDNITDLARGRVMAQRAAFAVALRNLLEVVKGVRVDSTTVVENFMLKSDTIQTTVSGFVKGARTVKEKGKSDGSVEVTVTASLWGEAALTAILADEKQIGQRAPETAPSPEGYTEIILDARGMDVDPAMFPVITDESGNVIYSSDVVRRADALHSGMAKYVTAKSKMGSPMLEDGTPYFFLTKGGRKPLRIKALGKDKKLTANVIISAEDAKKIKKSDKMADFLHRGRVTIVVDTLIGGTESRLKSGAWRMVREE